jgi:hypothetical protein
MRSPVIAVALSVAGVACAPAERSARHVLDSCVEGDSVVFSTVEASEESGDIAGFELVLRRTASGWAGTGREAVGDFTGTMPLLAVRLQPPDSVSLAMPLDVGSTPSTDTLVFRGRADCESLRGRQRDYRANPEESVTYRRHRAPKP